MRELKVGIWVCILGLWDSPKWGTISCNYYLNETTRTNIWLIKTIDNTYSIASEKDIYLEGELNPFTKTPLVNPHIPTSVRFIKQLK